MIEIESALHGIYTTDELELFRDKTFNKYTWNPFGRYYSHNNCKAMMPLALLNPDNSLKVYSHAKNSLSASEAETETLMAVTFGPKDLTENNLTVVLCKRGWTFGQAWAEQHGYTRLDRIELYLVVDVNHKIRVFKKDKHVLVITNNSSQVLEERLFSALPLIYKNEFTWNDETIEFFRSVDLAQNITPTTAERFIEIIKKSKILDNIKYEQLTKIIEKTSTHTIDAYKKDEDYLKKDIENYETELKKLFKRLNETQALIAFYKPDDNIKDVVDYIYNNPYIVDYYSTSSSSMVIAIEAPLEYIDVPAFKQMLKNVNSYLYPKWEGTANNYTELTKGHPIEFVEMLKDLFLSTKYKVYTRAEIVLDFKNKEAKPLRKSATNFNDRPDTWRLETRRKTNKNRCIIPHMHIEYYDCWSGNKTNISKALHKNDLIGAIDICVNTTKDINVNDSAVFGRFIKEALVKPTEFNTGAIRSTECGYHDIPGDEYKTIWDSEKKCFRTFLDIFRNDYLKANATQTDFDVDFTDFIL